MSALFTRTMLFSLVALIALPGAALAQTDDGLFQQFQFNFSTPGARASAMGRAFIGLANDGTASVSNPAGLVQLGNSEIYFEYKNTDLNIQRLAAVDSFFTNQPTSFGDPIDTFSFFSFTKKVHDRVFVAFTAHQFLNLEERFRLEPRPIPELADPGSPGRFITFFPSDGSFDMDAVGYAGSIAVNLATGLNVGLTISLDRISSRTVETRFDFTPFSVNPNNPGEVVVNRNSPRLRSVIDDTDTAVSFTLGGLYEIRDGLSAGAVYSRGARFKLEENFLARNAAGILQPVDLDGNGSPDFPKEMSLNVPDRYGFGFSISPTRLANIDSYRLVLAFDAVRIEYSDLLNDFTPVISAIPSNSPRPLGENDFEIDNVTEVHFGGELGIPVARNLIFLRGGFFTNPDHRQRYVGNSGSAETDAIFSNLFKFPEDNTEYGFTFGGGVTLANRFKADVAYLNIDSFNEVVVSLAFTFQ